MTVKVLLIGVGGVEYDMLLKAAERATERFPINTEILVPAWREYLPLEAYDFARMQWRAWQVNSILAERYSLLISPPTRLLVGVVNGDGFATGTNYVFGLATPTLGVASIYLARIRGSPLLLDRLTKLILHETGHLLGLGHCTNPSCVMRFSNNLAELDEKSDRFCDKCALKLRRRFGGV